MQCPKCNAAFRSDRLGGIPVQVCPSCSGIWFDPRKIRAYLGQALERAGRSPVLVTLRKIDPVPTDLTCPACRETWLRTIKPHGVELEQCSGCRGVFLDPGEIDLVSARTVEDPIEQRATAATPLEIPGGSLPPLKRGVSDVIDVLDVVLHVLTGATP